MGGNTGSPAGLDASGSPAGPGEVLGGSMMQTRTDLARGGEPGDQKAWLASLKVRPKSGVCRCGAMSTAELATEAERIVGRNWGLRTVELCGACLVQREIAQLKRSLEKPELLEHLRVEYEARLRALEQIAA